MGWLIGTIIFIIAAGVGLILAFGGLSTKKRIARGELTQASENDAKWAVRWGFGVFGSMLFAELLLTFFTALYIIPAGHVGVQYGFGGGSIVPGRLDDGTHFIAPWRTVRVASVQVQKEEFRLYPGTDAGPAVSSEAQPVFARLTVNYKIDPQDVSDLYRTVGPNWFHTLVEGRVLQDFKEITAKYKSIDITPAREKIRELVRDALRKEMKKYSIKIVDVQLSNLGFPTEFEHAILAKQVATQQALAAQARVDSAFYEGRAKLKRAQGEAEANRLLAKSVTPELVRLKGIEKLNPNVEVIYLPTGANLFLPGAKP